MRNEHSFDPYFWWHRLYYDGPANLLSEAYRTLVENGFLDASALWRQFYDSSITFDFLRWYSICIYVGGCTILYFAAAGRPLILPSPAKFLEIVLPRNVRSAASFKIDLQMYVAGLLKLPQVMRVAGLFMVSVVGQYVVSAHAHLLPGLRHVSEAINELPEGWQHLFAFLIAFLTFDFGYYWGHRLCHRSQILWQFHKLHHYSRQLNMLGSVRHHPIEVLVTNTLGDVAMILALSLFFEYGGRPDLPEFGAAFWVALPVVAINIVLNRFTHSHVVFSLGPTLDRVFVTPAVHVIHHSRDIRDVNYGNAIAIWDVMFGTYHQHDVRTPIKLGITEFDDGHYRNIVQALFEPFKDAFVVVLGSRRIPFMRWGAAGSGENAETREPTVG